MKTLSPMLYFTAIFMFFVPLSNLLASLLIEISSIEPTSGFRPESSLFMSFLLISLLPSIYEEIVFRGLLQSVLSPLGVWAAIILTSIVFTALHMGNVAAMPLIFVLSVFICVGKILFVKLWYAVLLHFLNNFFAFLMYTISVSSPDDFSLGLTLLAHGLVMSISLYIIIKGRKTCPKLIFTLWQKRKSKQKRLEN